MIIELYAHETVAVAADPSLGHKNEILANGIKKLILLLSPGTVILLKVLIS